MKTLLRNRYFKIAVFSFGVILLLFLAIHYGAKTHYFEKKEFEKNRQVWNKSGIRDYKMKIVTSGGGHGSPSGEFILTVRGGENVSIVRPDKPSYELTNFWGFNSRNNIDKVFKIIEKFFDSASENKELYELTFDSKFGYPKSVGFSFDTIELHSGFSFKVIEFEVLK